MQKITFMDKYPVFTKKILKTKTSYKTVDEIVEYFYKNIEEHPIAVNIGVFDHYKYTSSLEVHEINENIIDAKNIICCFGDKLKTPVIAAVRPRSFGIVLMKDCFVISFIQAPSPVANSTMIEWVEAIENI